MSDADRRRTRLWTTLLQRVEELRAVTPTEIRWARAFINQWDNLDEAARLVREEMEKGEGPTFVCNMCRRAVTLPLGPDGMCPIEPIKGWWFPESLCRECAEAVKRDRIDE